jgi:hypothetical protein
MRLPSLFCSMVAASVDLMRLACRKHQSGSGTQVVPTVDESGAADQQDALHVQCARCPVIRHSADKSSDASHACKVLSTGRSLSAKAFDPNLERAEVFTALVQTECLTLLHQAGTSEQPVLLEAPIWRLIRGPAVSLFAIYALTLAIFPGFLSEVCALLLTAAHSVVHMTT